jgi:hypothetical protein
VASLPGGVRKRYSEFEALRVELEKRYGAEGLLVPALPPKRAIGNHVSTQAVAWVVE